jgi:hypothetical protein
MAEKEKLPIPLKIQTNTHPIKISKGKIIDFFSAENKVRQFNRITMNVEKIARSTK